MGVELVYYHIALQHVNHYATGSPSEKKEKEKKLEHGVIKKNVYLILWRNMKEKERNEEDNVER